MTGAVVILAVAVVAGIVLGHSGSGGGGAGGHGGPRHSGSGSGANPPHLSQAKPEPNAVSSPAYYTGPGAQCTLAPRSRGLPPWSGCVSRATADLTGDGSEDLILAYSRLSRRSLGSTDPLSSAPGDLLYPAEEAVLRVIAPDGHILGTTITYRVPAAGRMPATRVRAQASNIISVAKVNGGRGREIFLGTGRTSSGSVALAYGVSGNRLVSSGALLAFGGDSATHASFQCVAGTPPRLVQQTDELIRGLTLKGGTIYGRWAETRTTYAWHGSRLVEVAHTTVTRLAAPGLSVGSGCRWGIA